MHRFLTITFALSCVTIAGMTGCSDDDDDNNGGMAGVSGSGGTSGAAGTGGGGSGGTGAAGSGGTGAAGSGGTGAAGSGGTGGSGEVAEVVTCPATPDTEIQAGGPPPFAFTPATASIGAGDVVEFTNTSNMVHDAASGMGGVTPAPDGRWETGDIAPSASVCVRFNVAGSYPFFCSYHPATMMGTITVQ